MITTLLLRYVLPVVGVLALLFGTYEYGKSTGYNTGYASGHQIAWDTQQKTINNMVDQQNLENTQANLKISALEFGSMTAQAQVTAAVTAAKNARAQAIADYKKANPVVAQSCGWSPSTVSVINQLLQPAPDVPVPASGVSQ
jgi:hypothetical protein